MLSTALATQRAACAPQSTPRPVAWRRMALGAPMCPLDVPPPEGGIGQAGHILLQVMGDTIIQWVNSGLQATLCE